MKGPGQATPAQSRDYLKWLAAQIQAHTNEVNDLAAEVEAHVMKKTTQRSPEFWGRANC